MSFIVARTIIKAANFVRTAPGGFGIEVPRTGLPLKTSRIDQIQSELGGALNGRTVDTCVSTDAKRYAFIVKLLTWNEN